MTAKVAVLLRTTNLHFLVFDASFFLLQRCNSLFNKWFASFASLATLALALFFKNLRKSAKSAVTPFSFFRAFRVFRGSLFLSFIRNTILYFLVFDATFFYCNAVILYLTNDLRLLLLSRPLRLFFF